MSNTATALAETADDHSEDFAPQAPTEMEVLKSRAKMMGIVFSNNIKIETLRQKISDKMDGITDEQGTTDDAADQDELPTLGKGIAPEAPTVRMSKREMEAAAIADMVKENMRLIRLRITNMDPKKKDLPGEIITIANEYIGTVRKYIPFGETTDDGYHVPYVLYQMMKDRKFLDIRTSKKNGQIVVSSKWASEFALEVLPQLTQEELDRLAAAQLAAGSIPSGGME